MCAIIHWRMIWGWLAAGCVGAMPRGRCGVAAEGYDKGLRLIVVQPRYAVW